LSCSILAVQAAQGRDAGTAAGTAAATKAALTHWCGHSHLLLDLQGQSIATRFQLSAVCGKEGNVSDASQPAVPHVLAILHHHAELEMHFVLQVTAVLQAAAQHEDVVAACCPASMQVV
jgi:hypothetical protein